MMNKAFSLIGVTAALFLSQGCGGTKKEVASAPAASQPATPAAASSEQSKDQGSSSGETAMGMSGRETGGSNSGGMGAGGPPLLGMAVSESSGGNSGGMNANAGTSMGMSGNESGGLKSGGMNANAGTSMGMSGNESGGLKSGGMNANAGTSMGMSGNESGGGNSGGMNANAGTSMGMSGFESGGGPNVGNRNNANQQENPAQNNAARNNLARQAMKAAPPPTLKEQSVYAFQSGNPKLAYTLLQSHALTLSDEDAVEILQHYRWSTHKKRLQLGLNIAVGVTVKNPKNMTDLSPIGNKEPNNGASGLGDMGMGGMAMGGMGAGAMGRGSGGGGFGNANAGKNKTLADTTGSFGTELVAAFKSKHESGAWSPVFSEYSLGVPSNNSNQFGGGAFAGNAFGGNMFGGNPSGFQGGNSGDGEPMEGAGAPKNTGPLNGGTKNGSGISSAGALQFQGKGGVLLGGPGAPGMAGAPPEPGMSGMAGPGNPGMAGPGNPGMAGPGMAGMGMAGPGNPGMAGPGMAGMGMAGPGNPGMGNSDDLGSGMSGPGMFGNGIANGGTRNPGPFAAGRLPAGSSPLAPCLTFIGVDETSKLMKKAVQEGYDGLMLFEVTIGMSYIYQKATVTNDTLVRVVQPSLVPKDVKRVYVSQTVNNIQYAKSQAKGDADGLDDIVEKTVKMTKEGLALQPIPSGLTPELIASKRIPSLATDSETSVIDRLSEVNFYYYKGFIDENQKADAFEQIASQLGRSVAMGTVAEKKDAVEKLLERELK